LAAGRLVSREDVVVHTLIALVPFVLLAAMMVL
jgi:hypothetical protein